MITFILGFFRELIKLLPAAVARVLLILTLLGGISLHLLSVRRIEVLERGADAAQIKGDLRYNQLLRSVDELAIEVRGYRADILEQNKELRKR